MTSPTFAKWRPRRETLRKVTSRLYSSVFSSYYFQSCNFRQWKISDVKKKCRPMNVCAFLGGKTTEHESFSAQRNASQGAKHLKNKVSFNFLILEKIFFWNRLKICLLMVVFWCSAWRIQIVLCFGRCNSQSRAGFLLYVILHAVGWKSKSTSFLWQKDAAGLFAENRNHGLTWSRSGNNKTVQTLLSLFESYYQGRKYALQSEESHL